MSATDLRALGVVTVVIKVGTSSLVRSDHGTVNLSSLSKICEAARDLRTAGHNVVIVSSGAVGVGCQRLKLAKRPSGLARKQAVAAVGQVYLMHLYDQCFTALSMQCAQVLLTLDNLADRNQYLNASNTFQELFQMGTIPIVNENDTVAVQQLRFGDNDTLSAEVATLVKADWLFLLTDVDHLYTDNPNTNPNAKPIHEVPDMGTLQVDTATAGTEWGTGGMATKLTAARLATAAGCRMVICSSTIPDSIPHAVNGRHSGTLFHPHPTALRGKKRWIPCVPVKGNLYLDAGAADAVRKHKKSLFPAGIISTAGSFSTQDAVSLCDAEGLEIARGLINYPRDEVEKIRGKSSAEIPHCLGYNGPEEVVHRANISLLVLSKPLSASQTSLDEIAVNSATRLPAGADATPAAAADHELPSGRLTSDRSCTDGSEEVIAASSVAQNAACLDSPAVAPNARAGFNSSSSSRTVQPGAAEHHFGSHGQRLSGASTNSAYLVQGTAAGSQTGSRQPLHPPGSSAQGLNALPKTPQERLALLKERDRVPSTPHQPAHAEDDFWMRELQNALEVEKTSRMRAGYPPEALAGLLRASMPSTTMLLANDHHQYVMQPPYESYSQEEMGSACRTVSNFFFKLALKENDPVSTSFPTSVGCILSTSAKGSASISKHTKAGDV
ncbi:hypothetical protein WJX74_001808 [Apatococcus lobatus]|uniref:PUA domain-containing protein n=1 Tax=Apatococcus lobatus TaxID=904363 RepID=A0AAW1Q2N3_9CHLO